MGIRNACIHFIQRIAVPHVLTSWPAPFQKSNVEGEMFPGGAKNSQLASVFTGLALIGAGLLPGLAVHHGLFDFFEKTLKLSATRTVYTGQAAIDKEVCLFDIDSL